MGVKFVASEKRAGSHVRHWLGLPSIPTAGRNRRPRLCPVVPEFLDRLGKTLKM